MLWICQVKYNKNIIDNFFIFCFLPLIKASTPVKGWQDTRKKQGCVIFYATTTIISTYSAVLSLKTLTHDCVSYVSMHMEDIKYMSNKIKQVIKSK